MIIHEIVYFSCIRAMNSIHFLWTRFISRFSWNEFYFPQRVSVQFPEKTRRYYLPTLTSTAHSESYPLISLVIIECIKDERRVRSNTCEWLNSFLLQAQSSKHGSKRTINLSSMHSLAHECTNLVERDAICSFAIDLKDTLFILLLWY